jgi:hypothetical protein
MAKTSATSFSITIRGDDYRDLMIGVGELPRRGYIDPKNSIPGAERP